MFHAPEWLQSLVHQELDKKELENAIERVCKDKSQISVILKFAQAGDLILITQHMGTWIKLISDWKEEKGPLSQLIELCFAITSLEEGVDQFLSQPSAIQLLIDLMDQYPLKLEYQIIRLFNNLGRKRPIVLAQILLQTPTVIHEFVERLEYGKVPYIRNETLLLLKAITPKNQDIQKIVAYGDGFRFLLTIIKEEGGSNGTEIVEDCLEVLRNLLDKHTLLVNLFRDSDGIRQIIQLLELENESDLWVMTDEKIEILLMTMQIIEIILQSANPLDLCKYQEDVSRAGGLHTLSILALDNTQTLSIKAQSLHTLSLLLRTNVKVSGQFSSQKEKLLTLIKETKHEKIRMNALSCMSGYLTENPEAQESFAKLNAASLVEDIRENHNYHSCMVLSFLLTGNDKVKEFLGLQTLVILLELTEGVMQSNHEQDPDFLPALLRVIVVWLHNSIEAVTQFRSNPSTLQFFLSLVEHHPGVVVGGLCALIIALNGCDNQFHMLELILTQNNGISIDRYVERFTTLQEQLSCDHLFNVPFLLIVENLYRSVVVKLIPHSNVASLKWEKIQESESRHLTERNKYLEGHAENLARIIKDLEFRLLPENAGSGAKNKNDILEMHQKQMKEKEVEIMTLMKRVNALSDNETMLTRLDELEKKITRLKQKLSERVNLTTQLSIELEENRNTGFSNMGVLQNRIGELERMNDALILLVGENALLITSYEEQLGIIHDSEEEEEEEEEEEGEEKK